MLGYFDTHKHYLEIGYPYLGVRYHASGDYPYVTFWNDWAQIVVYIVFVRVIADYQDVARAEAFGLSVAQQEREQAETPFDFEVTVEEG